ncbi:MAG: OmpP1/FadL family transporter, partial [Burkholderiales bacterium]
MPEYRPTLAWTNLARAAICVAVALSPRLAFATSGYFQPGYGLKSKGMGGVAVALPQDALVAATNPAGMVWIGNRLDVGLEQFEANRGSIIAGNIMGLSGVRDANERSSFAIPELGFNRLLAPDRSLGFSVYANGGMTAYQDNPLAVLNGSNPAGMKFEQGNFAPTYAMKLSANHSVGMSLNVVYQRVRAEGVQHFDDPIFSAYPGEVTNRGTDTAWGLGWRAGWIGRLTESLSVGAAYQPRISMEKFGKYKGLLADAGNFDVPENYTAGAAYKPNSALTMALDVQQINYG